MMKILQANKFFHQRGGAERVLFQERDLLKAVGVEVIDFSMHSPENMESDQSGYFISHRDYRAPHSLAAKLSLAGSFIHSREAVRNLKALVRAEKPDLAHLHNIYHHLTPSIIPALKDLGVPVVLTLHDFKLVCPAYVMLTAGGKICEKCADGSFCKPLTANCQGSRFKGALLAAEAYFHRLKKSYDGVDLFIAPSRFMAEMAARRVPAEKIAFLANGIEVDRLQATGEDHGYALYLGRLSREKGVGTLCKAQKLSRTPLKIVGTGPEEDALRSTYNRPEFLGYKSGNELFSLILRAGFVVVPSEWYENCPMVILEAMALGKPVLATRLGGIPDLVEDGVNGYLFEPGNAEELAGRMQELSADPELRSYMGDSARNRAEHRYSLAGHGRGLLDLYRQVLNGGTG